MSLAAACVQTSHVISHARSLFGDDPMTPETAADSLYEAARSSASAAAHMAGLSGSAVDAHRDFVDRAVPPLVDASRSDAELDGHLQRAAAVVAAGASRLDAIAEENQQTMTLAASANTPAAQVSVLKSLRSQVDRTQQVVSDTRQQAPGIAIGIQAVDYKTAPPLGPPPPAPGPPPPPLQNVPGPLQDFTKYQLNGQPIPNPPAPQVTADELRLKLMQQRIDYNDFVKWFNEKYGGHTSPEEMLTKIGTFEGATATLGGSLMALPEGIPLTIGAAILWLVSGYDLATADPGTARIPELGP